MGPDVLILWIGSLLCIVVALCAVVFAVMRRRKSVAVCGFILVALSTVIIGNVIGAAALDPGRRATVTARAAQPKLVATPTPQPTPTPMPTPTPTPKPTPTTPTPTPAPASTAPAPTLPASTPPAPKANSATLRRFEKAWTGVVGISVAAIRAHDAAGEYLARGNDAAAAGELKKCQEAADGIARESVNLPLEIRRRSDSELLAAIKKAGDELGSGCKAARSYLRTANAADFTESHTHFDRVADEIFRSESLARVSYQRLGGNPDTLLSYKTALR